MKTETKQVETFITRLYCDCGGEMIISDQWSDTQTRYIYQCPKCQVLSETMTERYPKIQYRNIPLIGQLVK